MALAAGLGLRHCRAVSERPDCSADITTWPQFSYPPDSFYVRAGHFGPFPNGRQRQRSAGHSGAGRRSPGHCAARRRCCRGPGRPAARRDVARGGGRAGRAHRAASRCLGADHAELGHHRQPGRHLQGHRVAGPGPCLARRPLAATGRHLASWPGRNHRPRGDYHGAGAVRRRPRPARGAVGRAAAPFVVLAAPPAGTGDLRRHGDLPGGPARSQPGPHRRQAGRFLRCPGGHQRPRRREPSTQVDPAHRGDQRPGAIRQQVREPDRGGGPYRAAAVHRAAPAGLGLGTAAGQYAHSKGPRGYRRRPGHRHARILIGGRARHRCPGGQGARLAVRPRADPDPASQRADRQGRHLPGLHRPHLVLGRRQGCPSRRH